MFKSFGGTLTYQDIIQLDGAFSAAHINYGESPMFNGQRGNAIALDSGRNNLSSAEIGEDVLGSIYEFDGTEQGCSERDRVELWKNYWLEYVNAFDVLAKDLPKSVVTAYVGRHAIEIGFKYALLVHSGAIPKTHSLKELSSLFISKYCNDEYYFEWVEDFCGLYCTFIEGGNAEYFRYPEYKSNSYFAGTHLDIPWISYNFALVLLKLVPFVGLDDELR